MNTIRTIALVAILAWSPIARGEVPCAHVSRENLAPCVRSGSFGLAIAHEDLDAARGRRDAAAPWLPSNPGLAATLGRREPAAGQPAAANWNVTVSQELEVAGQRGARVQAGDAGVVASARRVEVQGRDVLAAAWAAYFGALAARDEAALAAELVTSAEAFVEVAEARADKGLASPVDAAIARAGAVRLLRERLAAERADARSRADLGAVLGSTAVPTVAGDLAPLVGADEAAARASPRAEVRALEAEAISNAARAVALRRQRVPNPTLSVFAANEEFNTRVVGAGIAIPLPLPHPVGRTYAGEIEEAEALARRARLEAERVRRDVSRELATARQAYASRKEELDAFPRARVDQSRALVRATAEEVTAGRLSIRDAVVAQQSLLEFLRAYVETRLELCRASVELVRVSGLPLDGGAR